MGVKVADFPGCRLTLFGLKEMEMLKGAKGAGKVGAGAGAGVGLYETGVGEGAGATVGGS